MLGSAGDTQSVVKEFKLFELLSSLNTPKCGNKTTTY